MSVNTQRKFVPVAPGFLTAEGHKHGPEQLCPRNITIFWHLQKRIVTVIFTFLSCSDVVTSETVAAQEWKMYRTCWCFHNKDVSTASKVDLMVAEGRSVREYLQLLTEGCVYACVVGADSSRCSTPTQTVSTHCVDRSGRSVDSWQSRGCCQRIDTWVCSTDRWQCSLLTSLSGFLAYSHRST